jgi:hypothetical protein
MRLPSKTRTFWILMAASAVWAFLLPPRWTAPLRGLLQPLALFQWPATWLARKAHVTVDGLGSGAISAERAKELLAEAERLRLQVAQQRLRLEEVEHRLDEVSGLRDQLPDSHLRIVIAPVVSQDSSPRGQTLLVTLSEHQSRLLAKGKGQWVLAAGPRGSDDPEATIRDLLDREWVIGRVSEVHTRSARIQLTTDPRFRMLVRAARLRVEGNGRWWELAEQGCVLVGQGGGRMGISQAVENYYRTGYRVVVVPASRDLPSPMALGRIEASSPRDDSPQHFDLSVVPWGRVETLTHVYIVATEP